MLLVLLSLQSALAGPTMHAGASVNAARTGVLTDAYGPFNTNGSSTRVLPGINLSYALESPQSGMGVEAVVSVLGPPSKGQVINSILPFATRTLITLGPRYRMPVGNVGAGHVDFFAGIGVTGGVGVQSGTPWARDTNPAWRAGGTLMGGMEVGISDRTSVDTAWRSTFLQDVNSPYRRHSAWHLGTLSVGLSVRLNGS